MKWLLMAIIGISPIAGYVAYKQMMESSKIDKKMDIDAVKTEQKLNDFEEEWQMDSYFNANSKEEKKFYLDKAKKAKQKNLDIEAKQKVVEKKLAKLQKQSDNDFKEMTKVVNTLDKENNKEFKKRVESDYNSNDWDF